jgi:hypothetical protein
MDTRGNGAFHTHGTVKIDPGEIVEIQVAGFIPQVPTNARSLMGSVAVTATEGAGFLRLFAGHLAGTDTSVINFEPAQTIANAFTVRMSDSGVLKVQAVNTRAHVIIDVTAYVL